MEMKEKHIVMCIWRNKQRWTKNEESLGKTNGEEL